MKKNITALLVIAVLLLGCNEGEGEVKVDHLRSVVIDNGINPVEGPGAIRISVDVADDEVEISRGLMFRQALPDNSGMLFIFKDDDYRNFWMKDTLIPLDMIFIDRNHTIIDIRHAVPCEADPCVIYASLRPARYVLEVNGNFTSSNNVRTGNKVNILN